MLILLNNKKLLIEFFKLTDSEPRNGNQDQPLIVGRGDLDLGRLIFGWLDLDDAAVGFLVLPTRLVKRTTSPTLSRAT